MKKRIETVTGFLSAMLTTPLAGFSQTADAKTATPNIVVFIADDAGMDFGCYGNKGIKTPHIDRLASLGVRFENAFLTSPQSSPSRTSMLTGKFAHTVGTEDLHVPLDTSVAMLPEYLRKAGYTTAFALKSHWGARNDRKFDTAIKGGYQSNQGGLSEDFFNNYTSFIEKNKANPFFLWVGFTDPHRPYGSETIPQVNRPQDVTVPVFLVDDRETRDDLADYYNEISRMDGNIGRMMEVLERNGLMENTVIFFLSDNGMPFPRAKGTLYDSGIHTPLVVYWKNRAPEGTVHGNGLVSTIDLAPTILDIAGMDKPADMFGMSLVPLIENPAQRGRDYIFSERNWHDTDEYMRCIRTERYKVIYNAYYELPHGTPHDLSTSPSWYSLRRNLREGLLEPQQMQIFTSPRAMIEVYDLENDPEELINVGDQPQYREEAEKLTRMMVEWQQKTGDHPYWKRRRPDQSDRITGLNYLPDDPEMMDD